MGGSDRELDQIDTLMEVLKREPCVLHASHTGWIKSIDEKTKRIEQKAEKTNTDITGLVVEMKNISTRLAAIDSKISNGNGLEQKQEKLKKKDHEQDTVLFRMEGKLGTLFWILALGVPGTMGLIGGLIYLMIQHAHIAP